MDLRPQRHEDICQIELLQQPVVGRNSLSGIVSSGSGATTVLPIMVFPTNVLPAGATLLPAAPLDVAISLSSVGSMGKAVSGEFSVLQANEQHPQQQQQQLIENRGANFMFTSTLNKSQRNFKTPPMNTSTKTLQQNFKPITFVTAKPTKTANIIESDFEGSECGASVSTTTCMPHFRFGGCGMILHPGNVAVSVSQQPQCYHQEEQHHRQQEEVIGCASLSHMMGSFAPGGPMHSSRFASISSTLTRNRRGTSGIDNNVLHSLKRVSFKDDNLPPPSPPPPPSRALAMHEIHPEDTCSDVGLINVGMGLDLDMGRCGEFGLRMRSGMTGNINNCSYMHFENDMDYQTTGFGGLPDVTEHSNMHRTLSQPNSTTDNDSADEIASIQKAKLNFGSNAESPPTSRLKCKNKFKATEVHEDKENSSHKSRRSNWIVSLTLICFICILIIAATLIYQQFHLTPHRNSHAQRLRIVHRILSEVPLIDGHNNFPWNVHKYAHSSLELVHLNHDLDHNSMWTRPIWAQTDMERLKQGLVGVQVWSAYVPCEAQGLDAVQLALEQIDIIRRLSDMYAQKTTLVTSSQDIVSARRNGLMGSLIGIGGGHAIGSSLGVLRSFYTLGARYLSLTHKCDVSWAGSGASPFETGLTQFGKAIIREMNRLGMMIDLSYSSDATAREVLQTTRAPVIFSHSAARQLCNSTHNIPDETLRLVAENGGLIMISFDSKDISCGRQARLNDVVDHIKYIRSIAGIQHIGLGAGYDGIEVTPEGLEDVSKYPVLLASLLEDHNWTEEDIAMLAGKNFIRIIETVENVRDYWKRAAIQPIEQTEPHPKTQCAYMQS